MTEKRSRVASGSRGLMSLLALSCIFVWSCAADMTAGVAEEDQDGMVTDSPVDETETMPGDEVADEETGDEVQAGDPVPGAECVAYGSLCAETADCCAGMSCAFDGYIHYCRND